MWCLSESCAKALLEEAEDRLADGLTMADEDMFCDGILKRSIELFLFVKIITVKVEGARTYKIVIDKTESPAAMYLSPKGKTKLNRQSLLAVDGVDQKPVESIETCLTTLMMGYLVVDIYTFLKSIQSSEALARVSIFCSSNYASDDLYAICGSSESLQRLTRVECNQIGAS